MRIHLQKEIDQLKVQVFHLAALVEESFDLSVEAVLKGEAKLGESIGARDREIDRIEVEVEEDCLKILALHQPVAVDLRFLIAVLKMNNDLERIGDLAVNIAGGRACRNGLAMPTELATRLEDLAAKARGMLRASLNALIERDAKASRSVLAADDEVDGMYREFSAEVRRRLAAQPNDQDVLVSWLMAAKSIERIADHATNIAEDTIYTVEGNIVRHGRA